ncbi:MAG TPA: hypothetical protein VIZ31_00355 [Vicinamibacteria bacterium]
MPESTLPILPAGLNLPWQHYGCDFGANAWQPQGGLAAGDRRERLDPVLAMVAESGARVVRWFLLGDGRSGLRFDSRGRLLGLDACVAPDVEAALGLLERHGLRAMFVLTDFLWFARGQSEGGVKMFGKRELVANPERRLELLERVVSPLVRAFANDPRIHSWDAFNEPEWAVLGLGTRDSRVALRDVQMKAYLAELVARIRSATRHPVTVGLAGPRGLGLVRSLGLDFYQWHWYDTVEADAPLAQPVSVHQLERPVLLGEFPTLGSARTAGEVHRVAGAAGYAAAWPWSLLAEDEATDRLGCCGAVRPPHA